MQSAWKKFRRTCGRLHLFFVRRVTQAVTIIFGRQQPQQEVFENHDDGGNILEPKPERRRMLKGKATVTVSKEKPTITISKENPTIMASREMPSTSRVVYPHFYTQKDYRKGRRAQKKRNKKRATARRKAAERKAHRNSGLANMKIKL